MCCIKYFLLFSVIVGITRAFHVSMEDPASTKAVESGVDEAEKPRFLDLEGFIASAMKGVNINVDHRVSQGTSFVNSVTQSQTIVGGQSIVKTQVTGTTGSYGAGIRSGRGLFHDLADSVEKKTDAVKDKLSGAIADGINLAHSGYNKIKDNLKEQLK